MPADLRPAYCGIVLNLHGEVLEALAPEGMTLEEAFLPTLKTLHERFPALRIVVCRATDGTFWKNHGAKFPSQARTLHHRRCGRSRARLRPYCWRYV
jgi:dihydroorotase